MDGTLSFHTSGNGEKSYSGRYGAIYVIPPTAGQALLIHRFIDRRPSQSAYRCSSKPQRCGRDQTQPRYQLDACHGTENRPRRCREKMRSSRSMSIRIPKVRRTLPMHEKESLSGCYSMWLVMDFIDGDVMETTWPQMSWWNRLWTVWKLRKFIRELHHVPVPRPNVPGPFDSTDKALACSGYNFSETGAGPFESYSAMADWFDHLRYSLLVDLHMNYGSFKPHLYPMFDASHPPVLCHMDLNMRNIIVDKRGDVWLVDWGMAGAFPP
ncbi:uncharacterized protein EV420DRAFT_1204443 [Desarmillaria tabescens]|uniref:Aminoglycoside phosphotransferase domain-containing protein n=1 Tax=Armillaria tabescens TaxID=1929756 RepID=A0AA39JEC6_ARMTA|nr:uncharacterized protein EV420DRAFT_1204443 [Desarmillaria tabescens]KAK0439048.1 hypothetical protein EV420DRAFT_1204443 [Desarmillaria tabescens]